MAINYSAPYQTDGFVSGIEILSQQESMHYRRELEKAEARVGNLHYAAKVHTILASAYELAAHSKVLDIVEQFIGPDILIYNTVYIIKEPKSESYVSWHQDLTYWGLDSDDQVSMWLALSVADKHSGCMRMLRGSHLNGMREHQIQLDDKNNVLFQGQTVRHVDEREAVYCELMPGQASFHHGWTLHASMPNLDDDRRIGFNVQYIAPHVRQTKKDGFSALLVRGKDDYGYYAKETPARTDLDPDAMRFREEMEVLHREIAANGNA